MMGTWLLLLRASKQAETHKALDTQALRGLLQAILTMHPELSGGRTI